MPLFSSNLATLVKPGEFVNLSHARPFKPRSLILLTQPNIHKMQGRACLFSLTQNLPAEAYAMDPDSVSLGLYLGAKDFLRQPEVGLYMVS